MSEEKKKRKQIDSKDLADEKSRELGLLLEDMRINLTQMSYKQLLTYSSQGAKTYIDLQNRRLLDFSKSVDREFKINKKEILKYLNQSVVDLGISKTPTMKEIEDNLDEVKNQVIRNHRESLININSQMIGDKLETPSQLYPIIQNEIKNMDNKGVVIYANGTKRSFSSYLEMKFRTDTQIEIGRDLVESSRENSVAFFTCSTYGDCASDHVDLQSMGIFYDEDYADIVPEDRLEEVEDFIASKKLMSIQEAMGEPYWFTTRPNCRHYFDAMPLDDALGCKSKEDVQKYQEENGYSFGGKYKPEKYELMQEQRANERSIRKAKEKLEIADQEFKKAPKDLDETEMQRLKDNVIRARGKVMKYQAEQRALLKKRARSVLPSNADSEEINKMAKSLRSYDREKAGFNRTAMGIKQKSQYKATKNKDLR